MAPPAGVEHVAGRAVVDELPPALVELALWLADYYGSTPARALELVAPVQRARAASGAQPAERDSLAGEAAPGELSADAAGGASRGSSAALDAGRRPLPALRRDRQRQDRGLPAGAARRRSSAGCGAIVLVPEIALTPQTVGRFRARFGDADRAAPLGARPRPSAATSASGSRAARRGSSSARARRSSRRCRGLGLICVDEEHDASYKQESDPRYDARTVAAKRAALEGAVAVFGSATPRPESWGTLERARARRPARRRRCRRCASSTCAARPATRSRRRCSRSSARRGARRQGDPAAQPPRRRARAPLPRLRDDAALPELRRRARRCTATSRLRCHHCGHTRAGAGALPRLRLGRARADRRGHAAARARARARSVPELERIRLDADTAAKPRRSRTRSSASRAADRAVLARHADGREGPPLRRRRARRGRRRRHGARRCRTSAPRSGRSSSLTQLAGRSGRDAPGRVLVQTFQPDARADRARRAARRRAASSPSELERRRALGYPPFRHLVRIVVAGPDAGRAAAGAASELKAGLGGRRAARAGAAAAPARPPPRAARREDGRSRARSRARAARLLAAAAPAMRRAGLTAVVDVDPQSLRGTSSGTDRAASERRARSARLSARARRSTAGPDRR